MITKNLYHYQAEVIRVIDGDTFDADGAGQLGKAANQILVANNLRDIPTDTVAGKRTLAAETTRPLRIELQQVEARLAPELARKTLEHDFPCGAK